MQESLFQSVNQESEQYKQGTAAASETDPGGTLSGRSAGTCGENAPHSRLLYVWGTISFYQNPWENDR